MPFSPCIVRLLWRVTVRLFSVPGSLCTRSMWQLSEGTRPCFCLRHCGAASAGLWPVLPSLTLGCCHLCLREQGRHPAEWGYDLISAISSVYGRLSGSACSWGLLVTPSASPPLLKAACPGKTLKIVDKIIILIPAGRGRKTRSSESWWDTRDPAFKRKKKANHILWGFPVRPGYL